MREWHSKQLGDGILAYAPRERIRELFQPMFAAAGNPAEMAVFVRHDSDGRLHCEVTAYFSPAATALARALDAEPCNRPERDGLDLLAGSPGCWSKLFPEDAK